MGFKMTIEPKTLIEGTGFYSKWWAVHQPINFGFERVGFVIDTVVDNDGNAQVTTTQEYTDLDINEGLQVFIVSDVYNGYFTILEVINEFEFVIDTPYISNAVGSVYDTEKKNVYLELTILKLNPITTLFESIGSIVSKHDSDFNYNINVAPFLKNTIEDNNTVNIPTSGNYADRKESGIFKISTTEFYNNSQAGTLTGTTKYYFVNAIMQIQNKYGSNLGIYVPVPIEGVLSKFLSAFLVPTYFKGFPLTVSFIYNDAFDNENFTLKQLDEVFDQNGNHVESNFYYINSEIGAINRAGLYPTEVDVSKFKLSHYYDTGGEPSTLQVSEEITIDVASECYKNPIFLMWTGTNGSKNSWLFDQIQINNLDTSNKSTFEPSNENLEFQEGKVYELENEAQRSINLVSIITKDKIEGISTMLYSINVVLLMNPSVWNLEGAIWQSVTISKGSFSLYEIDDTNVELKLTINLPSINIQTK